MISMEEHRALLHGLWRQDHEEFVAEVRGWAEHAEANGWSAAARQHRQHLARLETMPKPWETSAETAGQ